MTRSKAATLNSLCAGAPRLVDFLVAQRNYDAIQLIVSPSPLT